MIFARLIPPRVPAMRCHSLRFNTAGSLVPPFQGSWTPIAERSNITIAIVVWIPALLWAYTAIVLGTAVATAEAGRFDARNLLEALLIGVLIQGYETHAVNEIFDWRSGTDRDGSPRVLSGGSRVLTARLLEERHLWAIFAGSSILIWVLALDLAARTGPLVLALVGMGYFAGLLYTLPPIATAYRPFAGEWLGGFVGVTAGGLGAYYVQALRITPLAVAVAVAHACVCVGMLLMHHYLDADADRRARPMKR